MKAYPSPRPVSIHWVPMLASRRLLGQRNEQLEFNTGERHDTAVGDDFTLEEINRQSCKTQHSGVCTLRFRAAQQRTNTCHQLTGLERFGQVIVGTNLQSEHAVHLIATSSEHHKAKGRVRRTPAARKFETITVRQHYIKQNDVRLACR